MASPDECVHRGAPTGEMTECPTCPAKKGFKTVPLHTCKLHDECTVTPALDTTIAACSTCPDRVRPPAPIVMNHGAAGIGDALQGMGAANAVRVANPGRHTVYRVSAHAKPWVDLFDLADEIGVTHVTNTPDTGEPELQVNLGYQEEESSRCEVPRWERYRANVGAPDYRIPSLREPERLRAFGADLAGSTILSPWSTDVRRTVPLAVWQELAEKIPGRVIVLCPFAESPVPFGAAVVLCGATPERVAGVILNARRLVGNDSGMAHLSGILGVPTIVLAGQWPGPMGQLFGIYPKMQYVQRDRAADVKAADVLALILAPRVDLIRQTVPFREYTADDDAEQMRHLESDQWLYEPGQPRYACSLLGAVHEELIADRPDLAKLVREAVWIARKMNDQGIPQHAIDWDDPTPTETRPPIFIPFVNRRDLLDEALASLGEHAPRAVVVDNSGGSEAWPSSRSFRVYRPDAPLTVAQTFWLAMRRAPGRWSYFHNDATVTPEVAAEVDAEADRLDAAGVPWGVILTLHDVYCLHNGKLLRERGIKPDLCLPVYCCDCDWLRQITTAGLEIIDMGNRGGRVKHHGSSTKAADRAYRAYIDTANPHAYYREKWGGLPGEETKTTPWAEA
ncbi:hypothetical protein FRUB_09821 [Fimbriiglobus ruber]|uniref:Glycosyltransferase n=2 Tax=Fimbriiglobus ruber TaxID=1908690 RepID=A0A225DCW0_9BACT|nr:hypothetical protein FRUB_09821 [Fimbriiglobus ruber]